MFCCLSTEGSRLAYSMSQGSNADLWVYDWQRGRKTRLTNGLEDTGPIRPMFDFKRFDNAVVTISGIELAKKTIKKGQFKTGKLGELPPYRWRPVRGGLYAKSKETRREKEGCALKLL
jgi:hypothetical protein